MSKLNRNAHTEKLSRMNESLKDGHRGNETGETQPEGRNIGAVLPELPQAL